MTASSRRIDHLVLAVRDLSAAATFYERLGFDVGARNRHPWGTENHVIQFASSFLELITVADHELIPPHQPGRFSFGRYVRDYLSHREGLAMLVLDSDDADADAEEFARRGIGDFEPFSFERAGRRSDGTPTRVGFTLAFAVDPRLADAAFFTCQQHFPAAFWSADLQRHANGATNVAEVILDVPEPGDHGGFVEAFSGATAGGDEHRYPLSADGAIRVISAERAGRFTGFALFVPDVQRVSRRLGQERIPFHRVADDVVVDAGDASGVRIAFRQAPRVPA